VFCAARLKSSPLLLAASSGALSTVQCLLELAADLLRTDQLDNNVIRLAALRCHANILDYFSQQQHQQQQLDVWGILVGPSLSSLLLHRPTRIFHKVV